DRRSASASPYQPQWLLSGQEGRQDQGRRLVSDTGSPLPGGQTQTRFALGRRRVRINPMQVTIAVDAMGGDHGPPVTVAASLRFLDETPDARIVLVGNEDAIRKALAATHTAAAERVSVRPASEIVAMHEPPADALRRKKDS